MIHTLCTYIMYHT